MRNLCFGMTDNMVRGSSAKDNRIARRLLPPLVTFVGWAFDVFTAVISVVDIVSDVLVAKHFYDGGHMLWFWLVVGSYLLASGFFTFFFVELASASNSAVPPSRFKSAYNSIPVVVKYTVTFLLAQLLPLVLWLLVTLDKPTATAAAKPSDPTPDAETSVVAEEMMEADFLNESVSRRLRGSLATLVKAHALFLLETVVEAVPQLVIQLLAMTFLGESSPVQILSVCVSLFSIISKAYVVADALDLRVFACNYAAAVFDLATFFFVFSTVLDVHSGTHDRVRVPDWITNMLYAGRDAADSSPELYVSMLSAAWAIKTSVLVGYIVTVGVLFAIVSLLRDVLVRSYRPTRREVFSGFLVALGWVCCFVPGVLALEVVKLTAFVLISKSNMPSVDDRNALIYAFVMQSGTSEETTHRMRHLMECAIATGLDVPSAQSWFASGASFDDCTAPAPDGSGGRWSVAYRRARPPLNRKAALDDVQRKRICLLLAIPATSFKPWMLTAAVQDLFKHASTLPGRDAVAISRFDPAPPAPAFVPPPPAVVMPVTGSRWWAPLLRLKPLVGLLVAFLLGLGMAMCVVHAVFNALFPLLHWWLAGGTAAQNVFQQICAVASTVSVVVLVAFGPRAIKYHMMRNQLRSLFLLTRTSGEAGSKGLRWIETYYYPTVAQVLAVATLEAVLPRDVAVNHLGLWLAPLDVGVDRLTRAECVSIRTLVGS